ncbi:MAG TPA: hypothetical protein VIF12_03640 [Micavibrio sp.]|jgi:hypothetical protein
MKQTFNDGPQDDLRAVTPEGVTKFGPGSVTNGAKSSAPTPPPLDGPGI